MGVVGEGGWGKREDQIRMKLEASKFPILAIHRNFPPSTPINQSTANPSTTLTTLAAAVELLIEHQHMGTHSHSRVFAAMANQNDWS
jgi:hypothetical protein